MKLEMHTIGLHIRERERERDANRIHVNETRLQQLTIDQSHKLKHELGGPKENAQKKGCPVTPPKSCSVVTDPQV